MKYLIAILASSIVAFAGGYFFNELRSKPDEVSKKREYIKLIDLVHYATVVVEENNSLLFNKVLGYAGDSLVAKSGLVNSAQEIVLLLNHVMDTLYYAKQLVVAIGGG